MNTGNAKFVDETWPRDDLVDYIMATTAVQGMWPYVSKDGTQYADSGLVQTVNIIGGVNRCLKDGFEESEIVVDAILDRKITEMYANMSGSKAYEMVMRWNGDQIS